MQPVSEDEIRRAYAALETAPATDTGLLIPPHVAAERQAEKDATQTAANAPANRAERRWQEKRDRRRARKEAKIPPKARETLAELKEAAMHMSDTEAIVAAAQLRDAASAGNFAREAFQDQDEGGRL